MSQPDKLVARFENEPKDFRWDELDRLLRGLGFREVKPGKTGGSRGRFVHPAGEALTLHKPHLGNIVKGYVVKNLLQWLVERIRY